MNLLKKLFRKRANECCVGDCCKDGTCRCENCDCGPGCCKPAEADKSSSCCGR
jgi:hypothetical protein